MDIALADVVIVPPLTSIFPLALLFIPLLLWVILPPVRIIVPVPLLSIAVYELLIEALSHISIFPASILIILLPEVRL